MKGYNGLSPSLRQQPSTEIDASDDTRRKGRTRLDWDVTGRDTAEMGDDDEEEYCQDG